MIWVTADLIGPEINFPGLERPSRMFCLQLPDSSGTSGLVDATWQPPLLVAENSPDDSSAGLLLIALTLVVATGVSVFAFRRRPEAPRP